MTIEHQLIATLARSPQLLPSITLAQDDFEDLGAGEVFAAVRTLILADKEPDMLIVIEHLNAQSDREWLPKVAEIWEAVRVPANVGAYQEIIRKAKRKSQLQRIAHEFLSDTNGDEPGAVPRLMKKLNDVQNAAVSESVHLGDYSQPVIDKADRVANGEIASGLLTGIKDLDDLTDGFQPGDSVIIAARTSVGKTAVMCNLAQNIDVPCAIISGEQSGVQIANRVLARMGGISAHRLRTGKLHQDEFPKLIDAAARLSQSKIHIVDSPRPSIDDIERIAQGMVWTHKIRVIFIDYLQLITNRAHKEKRLQIVDISVRLKALARELEITVITLAQLNRGADDAEQPRLRHLKESGAIEEDADLVILLYSQDDDSRLVIDLQKHRDGPVGHVVCQWDAATMTVKNS